MKSILMHSKLLSTNPVLSSLLQAGRLVMALLRPEHTSITSALSFERH